MARSGQAERAKEHEVDLVQRVMDIVVENHGSVMLFRPVSEEGLDWLQEHTDPEAMWWAGALVVEPRYAEAIADGAWGEGLVVG